MKKLFCLFLLAMTMWAQTIPHTGQFNYTIQTTPGPVPTSLTTVYAGDVYACYVEVQAAGQNILIQDMQLTPVPWLNGVLGTMGTLTTWSWVVPTYATCRHFPYGISWQASVAGATGYFILKHN